MFLNSPLQEIKHPLFGEKKIDVFVKRDDLIDPIVSGNKWRKLKYNIQEAKNKGLDTIVTFGGAYSNHISATARVGKLFGIKTIGVIRGEKPLKLNPTLKQCEDDGMTLHFVSRSKYKEKASESFISELKNLFGEFFLVPEGGGNELGVKGCTEIVWEIETAFQYIVVDCGTGATLAGIVDSLDQGQKAIGIPVLKQGGFIYDEVAQLLGRDIEELKDKFELRLDFHFGGYAKFKENLLDFMRYFYKETNIKTDPVYTGKLFYGFMNLVENNYFPKGSKIVVVHTGGLQGIEGFEDRYGVKIY